MILLTIDDIPVPWTPSRVTRSRHAFNPKYEDKKYAQWQLRDQYEGQIITEPVCLIFEFRLPIPKSLSKKKYQEHAQNKVIHTKKPDLTNLIKFAEDCLKGIVIFDDNQVYSTSATKLYSMAPCTLIKVLTEKERGE